MHESQNTEFKSSWHDDYLKWICGFANAIGGMIYSGMIYIGRDDNGKVAGLSDYAKLMEDLPNKIHNAMGIICDVQLHEEDEKSTSLSRSILILCRYLCVAGFIIVPALPRWNSPV